MNISKRSFIFGSMATTVLVSLWEIDVTKADVKIGNSPDDKKLLVKMIFLMSILNLGDGNQSNLKQH